MSMRVTGALAMLGAAALLTAGQPAAAQTATTGIDMTAALKDFDGKPISDPASRKADDHTPHCDSCTPITLGRLTLYALCANDPPPSQTAPHSESPATGAEKFKRCALGAKLEHDKQAVLSPEQLSEVKKRIGREFAPTIVVQSYRMLDPTIGQAEK